MAHIHVEVDHQVMFDGDVTDWQAPPTPPATPRGPLKAAQLPPTIRAVLAKAMTKALEQATGFKVTIHT